MYLSQDKVAKMAKKAGYHIKFLQEVHISNMYSNTVQSLPNNVSIHFVLQITQNRSIYNIKWQKNAKNAGYYMYLSNFSIL